MRGKASEQCLNGKMDKHETPIGVVSTRLSILDVQIWRAEDGFRDCALEWLLKVFQGNEKMHCKTGMGSSCSITCQNMGPFTLCSKVSANVNVMFHHVSKLCATIHWRKKSVWYVFGHRNYAVLMAALITASSHARFTGPWSYTLQLLA